MVSFNLKVLAKFGLCSNCSQKLDGCSLARARKIFAIACQMLVLAKINSLLADARKDHSTPLCCFIKLAKIPTVYSLQFTPESYE